jgi:hypothetical protein
LYTNPLTLDKQQGGMGGMDMDDMMDMDMGGMGDEF